jgi:hypothetical protein
VRRDEPLSARQIRVLKWISEGCPEGVWADFTYKTTAYALASRGLANVVRRRDSWSAAITEDGEFYLTHGRYPADPESLGEGLPSAETLSDADVLAAERLVALTSGEGVVSVASPSDRERARYRRAIHRLITGHQIPQGFTLRHTGRDHGDLHIRLVREVDEPRPEPAPRVVVPLSLDDVGGEVRALGSQIRMAVTEPSMDRALRILQAIANECATREWTLDRDPSDDRRFRIRSPECSFELGLTEELVNREVPDEATLGASKYSWQRIPLQLRKVGSGRLTLQLGQYYRTKSWSDRSRWTLDDKLGAMFAELDARVAEAAEERRQREADLHRRQQAWDAAVLAAQQAYVVDLNRRRLHEQVAHRAHAEDLRGYARTLTEAIDRCDDAVVAESIRSWQRWASQEADRLDPINHPDALRYFEPDTVRPEDYEPFMPKGMSAHRRPDQ